MHAYAPPAAVRKLDLEGSGGSADSAKSGAITAHRFAPEAGKPGSGDAAPAKASSPPAGTAPNMQKHSYVPPSAAAGPSSTRKALTSLAHRFVPGMGKPPVPPTRPDLADHSFLPDAPAKV